MRSVRVPLATEVSEGVHLVQPAGRGQDHYRPLLVAYGPVSGSILESLRTVGLRELNSEAEQLVRRNGTLSGEDAIIDRLPQEPFERGLEIWRALSLWSRIAEDLAALVRAIRNWRSDSLPGYVDCQIGRDYLRWVPSREDGVVEAFAAMSTADTARDVLLLPTPDELAQLIGNDDTELIEGVCSRTASDVSSWFRDTSPLLNEETQRTFARWKHRIAATSPGRVPLWIQKSAGDMIDAAESGFREGFSIIDWSPHRAATPELIIWTGEPRDFGFYIQAALHGIEMLGTLVDGLLRFVDDELPIIPWRSWHPPSEDEARAIGTLSRSAYRSTALARLRHGLQ